MKALFGYDAANRLTSYKGVTFGYRADNLRAWKQNAVSKTYYYYDGGASNGYC
jgi:hypothetical protein